MHEDKTYCLNPDPSKACTRVDRWKYNLVRDILLELIPADPPGVAFKDLASLVQGRLSAADSVRLGSTGWYTTTVKPDLEARGEIRKVEDRSPQYLVRGSSPSSGQEVAT